jgi:hypothetical protein
MFWLTLAEGFSLTNCMGLALRLSNPTVQQDTAYDNNNIDAEWGRRSKILFTGRVSLRL